MPPLFADASSGIQQFQGGHTMPVGSYFFLCDFAGNVSVQSGAPPYTVRMESGDHFQDVRRGDMVTIGWCKAFGPETTSGSNVAPPTDKQFDGGADSRTIPQQARPWQP